MKMYLDGNSRPGEGKVYQTKKEFEQAKRIEKLEAAVTVLRETMKYYADIMIDGKIPLDNYQNKHARLALKKVEEILK